VQVTESLLGDPVDTDDLASTVRDLGVLALDFGRVPRATFHQDGETPESDTTHTVMLGLLACALAERIGGLDLGAIAQFALVHDLPEVHAQDTSTLRLPTAEQQAAKKQREQDAWARIARQFGRVLPWVAQTIAFYDGRSCREADFVWGVDKITPKVTHIANGCATPRAAGVTAGELAERYAVQRAEMVRRCGEWPALIAVYDRLVEEELEVLRVFT
jgi:5'-deoxynucleotidase YfbR-like HD superfamily hydrolase